MNKNLSLCVVVVVIVSLIMCLSFTWHDNGNTTITVESKPDMTRQNSFYLNNRSPLVQSPLIKLPVSAIKPKGWLREYLIRQKNGLTGNLGKISAWLQKDNNAWLSKDGVGEYGWEEVPYWLKGYANLGYILNDAKIIEEAKVWLEGSLLSQRADGNFGPTKLDKNGAEDFWPKMIMLYCLQSYYEYSNDQRIIHFMLNFFRYQLNYPEEKFLQKFHYWQGLRAGDNLHSVLWLYNVTGESWLLGLAHKIYKNAPSWVNRNNPTNVGQHPKDKNGIMPVWSGALPDWHNVNITQGYRLPAVYSQLSGDKSQLQASYDAFNIVRKYFGQVPGGLFGGDEVSRPGYSDPHQAVETCGMVEDMNSSEEMLRISGDIFWADQAENVAFNSYPAAVMPDFKSLRYLTSPNMVLNDDKDHSPGIDNGGPYLMMNPFSSRCCQHNHTQGWPYFSENLWMATPDNGVAAVLYAASEVVLKVGNGTEIRFEENSHYPFEDKLEFKFHALSPVAFPFYLRIPAWSQHPTIWINGKMQNIKSRAGSYLKINRTWQEGDAITLKLPMQVKVKEWKENKNSVSVEYGPLTFSLKIGEELIKKGSEETAISESKWQKGVDINAWPSFEIHPSTPWNYGLELNEKNKSSSFTIEKKAWPADNFPFTTTSAPVVLKVNARQIPHWKMDQHGLCGELKNSPVRSNEPIRSISLIPMGAARLRVSAFPVIGKGNNATIW